MILTDKQFFDYLTCPAYYRLKYKKKIDIDGIVTIPKLLNKVATYFCLKLLSGEVPSTYLIKKQWDGICNKYSDYIDGKKALQGIGLLMKFYQWAAREKIIVVDINSEYMFSFTINNENYEFYGHTGIILARSNKEFELLIPDFSNKVPDQSLLDLKLYITLNHYAFKRTYGINLIGTKILNIKNSREYFTNRSEHDYKRMFSIVTNIAKAIKNDIWYPHENPLCSNCPVLSFCHQLS